MNENVRPSPWWYRHRDAVFGMLYGIGFFAGGLYGGVVYNGYVPLYVEAGLHFGSAARALAIGAMLVLMIAAFAVRVWGSSYLHTRIVWSENARTDSLVVGGPFRYTRNPLYLGNLLMAAGIGGFAPLGGWLVIVVLNAIFVMALIKWEEPGLSARYGEQFERYCQNVPAFVPRITPVPASGSIKPSLREGLRSEIFVGSLLLGTIGLFILPPLTGWCAFAALYIFGIVAQRIAARSTRVA